MSDNGLRLQVDTQEINADDAGKVMMLKNKIGYFLFAEQAPKIEDIDLPKIDLDDNKKTPSEELRARMFVYFTSEKGLGGKKEDFNNWYKKQISKIGQTYLDRIN